MNCNSRVTLTGIVHGSAASLNPIQRAWAIRKTLVWYRGSRQYRVLSKCLPAVQIMTVWYVTLTPASLYSFPYAIQTDNKRLFPLPRPRAQTTSNPGQMFSFAYSYYHTGWRHWHPWDWKLASRRQSNCTPCPNLWLSFVLCAIRVTSTSANAGAYADLITFTY